MGTLPPHERPDCRHTNERSVPQPDQQFASIHRFVDQCGILSQELGGQSVKSGNGGSELPADRAIGGGLGEDGGGEGHQDSGGCELREL